MEEYGQKGRDREGVASEPGRSMLQVGGRTGSRSSLREKGASPFQGGACTDTAPPPRPSQGHRGQRPWVTLTWQEPIGEVQMSVGLHEVGAPGANGA